jgi:hypothetical protein
LAEAFNNLAGMFAPPSGTELAGYATANAKREESQRLAEFYSYANTPNFDRERFDRLGVAAGRYNPNQSYYGVDQGNAVLRRGQDIDANTRMEQTRLQESGQTTRTMLAPVPQGGTRFNPPSVADMYSVPQTQIGVIETKPGERATLPDGRIIEGPAKPMSLDESKAGVFQQMPPDQQKAMTFGSTPLESIVMGDKPTLVLRPDAIGKQPVPAAGASAVSRKDGMAIFPDGSRVPVTRAPDALQWQTPDGSPLPQGAQVFDTPKPQGTNEQLGITNSNVTEGNSLQSSIESAEFATRQMREILQKNSNVAGIPGRVKGVLQSLSSSASQVAKAYVDQAPDAIISLNEARTMLDNVAGAYDPDIVRLTSGIMDLAYARAQIGNPKGEVSRQAFDRSLQSFGQSYLSSQKDMETALAAFEQDTLGAARVKVNSLRGVRPQNPPTQTPAGQPQTQSGAREEIWSRDPNTGRLVRTPQ